MSEAADGEKLREEGREKIIRGAPAVCPQRSLEPPLPRLRSSSSCG